MRLVLLSLACAALALGPTFTAAQSGPDASMAVASPISTTRSHHARPLQPEAGERPHSSAGRNDRLGPDCAAQDGNNATDQRDARADSARCHDLTDADIATAPIIEVRAVTRHRGVIGGRPIAYTATAGTLTIRDDQGKPTASMFYVAYTVGHSRGSPRPVTFFYNGGPGSSSLWLHMGSLAPVRVMTDSPSATHNAPYVMTNNNDSLLDKSDLVFLDAVGTGFSRPLGDTKLKAFWGTDPDIDAFARGIERYLTINDRWNSPKFIFGESYGTTRSAGLSYRLQKDGVQLNGVILLSSILNYGRRDPGFDQEMINYIPSYAAAAAYHHRLANEPSDLPGFLRQARDWARGPYAVALAKGQTLDDADRRAIAARMASFTGLSTTYILESNLRVPPSHFRKELLRDQRLTLGRYDDRFTGVDTDAAGASPSYDPSDTGITGAFVSAFHHYLTSTLDYRTDLTYRTTYYASGPHWDFHHQAPGADGPTDADVALDLSAAMRQNPHLLVYSLNGVYDLATPFFGTEYDLAHMQLDPSLRDHVRFAYFPSGHMVYLNPAALTMMKADLTRFYDEAAPG